jgi:hypothetical protein
MPGLRREASEGSSRVIDFLKRLEPLPELECDAGLLSRSHAAKFSRTRQPGVIEAGTCEANATTVCSVGSGLRVDRDPISGRTKNYPWP